MRGTPVRQIDFTGGLNTKAAPYLVGPNECRDCLNVVTTTRGSVKKRDGCQTLTTAAQVTALNAGATQMQALFGAVGVPTAGNVLLACDEDGQIYSVATTGTPTDISAAALSGSPLDVSMIQAPVNGGEGPIYILDGVAARQWTGSGNHAAWTASSGTLPLGKYMIYFKKRVWIAGVSATPNRLFWSDIDNPRVWPAANANDYDAEDGDAITGLGTAGPYLLVFKTNKIFVVYDLDTGANRSLTSQLGAVSHRSIVETPNGTFFLSKDRGVWSTDGKKLKQMSEKITPTLDAIVAAQRKRAAGGFLKDHYYLSICDTGTTNNKTLDYDTTTDSWWVHSNTANQFALWRPVDEQQLYAGIPASARIERCYVPTVLQDNATNYLCTWYGPWLTFGEPYRNKRLRQIHVDGTGIVDAYIARDYASSGLLLYQDIFHFASGGSLFGGAGLLGGDGIFGDIPAQSSRRLYTLGVARAFSFIIQATSALTMEMDAYTPMINLRQN